ncbi:hypothetical protein B296_00002359 [Ensete ventricosum]|uniref:Uncharacterized protein n=1 Tax=Ensete ventricosum TaxID=4639 RepID=A0A427B187_ENSVE|nr:hypothetical protein B296_00002359 [Ensete ventricosum]
MNFRSSLWVQKGLYSVPQKPESWARIDDKHSVQGLQTLFQQDRAPRDGCRDTPDAGDRFRREIDRGGGSGEAAVGQRTVLRCGTGMKG